MKVKSAIIPDVLLLEPEVFRDERGIFMESFNQRQFSSLTGVNAQFVQDNQSSSRKGVLHGLHFQQPKAQGKLVRVVEGNVFDVAVDIRRSSLSFGRWVGFELSASNRFQVWIPPGFAHGYLVLSETAEFLYKVTEYYAPEFERCIAWNDPQLGIDWPLSRLNGAELVLSKKDRTGSAFSTLAES